MKYSYKIAGVNNIMKFPDVVGFRLGDAKEILYAQAIQVRTINVTAPPREKHSEYNNCYRVVRMNIVSDNVIELLVCKPL